MRRVDLLPGADLHGFRRAVRVLIAEAVPPEAVAWTSGEPGLFGAGTIDQAPPVRLPRRLAELIQEVVPHRDPERYALLYDVIWRSLYGNRDLVEVASDPAVHRLELMRKAVRRDIHKMHAFLRFRHIEGEELVEKEERYVAWFEPEHFILETAAPFFVDRFRSMAWSILTPIGSAHWNRETLRFGPPGARGDAPERDGFEEGWRGYYESAFNPARTNPKLMRQHMPQKYWKNLPEAVAIPALVRSASSRVEAMLDQEPTMPTKKVPEGALAAMLDQGPKTLDELNAIIRATEPLVPGATQAVVGEGPPDAGIVFVGEQPGDEEDVKGRPFIGPAGRLLDRAMGEAGMDRSRVYVTNAVKHFKFEQRGMRRIHQKPTAGEVSHYRPFLMRELELIQPKLVVALGGTAVLALTGKNIPITRARGPAELLEHFRGFITVHPSYLLRIPDREAKQMAYEQFVADLQAVRQIGESARRSRAAE
jgi:probable DNA metabolism protein